MKAKTLRVKRAGRPRPLTHVMLFLLGALLLLPVILTFLYSFFSPAEIAEHLSGRGALDQAKWMQVLLVPRMASLSQYYQVMLGDTGILQRFVLSVFYTFCVLFGQALIIPAMAYALSSFRFKGRDAIFLLLILLMLLPFQVTMAPNVLMLRTMNLLNTVWAVILPMWFMPFYVFLLRQYMTGISRELYEAGQLDGTGAVHCFFHITLPLCKPVIGAAAALSFADVWNMVEQPMTFLSSRDDLQPLSTVFNRLISAPQGIEFAGAAIYILPALFVYLFFLEDVVSGIQLTELK